MRLSDEARAEEPDAPEVGETQAAPRANPDPVATAEPEDNHVTLPQLLERSPDEWDETIAHYSRGYAAEVDSLDEAQRADLWERLARWWPEESFADTVTFIERTGSSASWSMKNKPGAWLWFGPSARCRSHPTAMG